VLLAGTLAVARTFTCLLKYVVTAPLVLVIGIKGSNSNTDNAKNVIIRST
jgi:hypothetical protein